MCDLFDETIEAQEKRAYVEQRKAPGQRSNGGLTPFASQSRHISGAVQNSEVIGAKTEFDPEKWQK